MMLDRALLILIEGELSPTERVGTSEKPGRFRMAPDEEMCLKVGGGLIAVGEGKVEVTWTETELWILRERVSITAASGGNPRAGYDLKRMVYEELLALDTAGLDSGDGPDVLWKDVESAYQDFTRKDTDTHPKGRARKKASAPPEPGAHLPGPDKAGDGAVA